MSKHVPAGSKKTKIGLLPAEWNICSLESITDDHKQGFYTKESYVSNGIKLIRITDLGNPKIDIAQMPMVDIDKNIYEQFKVETGDFLFARSGAIGRYGIVEKEMKGVFASYLIRFRFNPDLANNYFVGLCYESDQCIKQLYAITQGSSNININAENIKSLIIPLPPLPEQRKIAAVLSSADRSIAATEKLIAKLSDLKKALMQQLLTKGIGHTEFKPSPLGPIPKSWEVEKAEVLLERKVLLALKDGNHGSFYPRANEFASNGLPFISASDIDEDGNINFSECKRLPLDKAKRLTIPPAIGGDVMLTHNATVGRVALLPNEIGPVIASTSTTYYRTNSDVLTSNYLKYYFSSPLYQQQLKEIMGQTTRNQVPITVQKDLFIIIPNIGEQIRLSAIFDALTNKQTAAKVKLAKAKDLKQGLMNDLLTGKARVSA